MYFYNLFVFVSRAVLSRAQAWNSRLKAMFRILEETARRIGVNTPAQHAVLSGYISVVTGVTELVLSIIAGKSENPPTSSSSFEMCVSHRRPSTLPHALKNIVYKIHNGREQWCRRSLAVSFPGCFLCAFSCDPRLSSAIFYLSSVTDGRRGDGGGGGESI